MGVTTALSALTTGALAGPAAAAGPLAAGAARWVALPVALLTNAALFVVAFRALTTRSLSVRQVAPGALIAALAWQLLELAGVRYAADPPGGADPLYGVFELVLALLAWIYLEAFVVVFAAEVAVVLADELWPRALLAVTSLVGADDLTDADRRSLASYARIQRYKTFERIEVAFTPDGSPGPGPGDPRGGAPPPATPAARSASRPTGRCPPAPP